MGLGETLSIIFRQSTLGNGLQKLCVSGHLELNPVYVYVQRSLKLFVYAFNENPNFPHFVK